MNKKLTAAVISAAFLLAGCGEEKSPAAESETEIITEAVTAASAETTAEAAETTSAAAEAADADDAAETTVSEKAEDTVPDAVKILAENRSAWESELDEAIETGLGTFYCWFQDMDMDGSPEFIIGGGSYGAHGASGFNIFKVGSGGVKPLEIINTEYDSRDKMLMFWTHSEEQNYTDPSGTGFIAQLFRRENGEFVYVKPSIDSTAMEVEYFMEEIVPADGGFEEKSLFDFFVRYSGYDESTGDFTGCEYLFCPEFDDDASDYAGTVTREEYLGLYDGYFSALTPYDVTVSPVRYAEVEWEWDEDERKVEMYLSDDDIIEKLTESYNAWGYSENIYAALPLSKTIDPLRSGENGSEEALSDDADAEDFDIRRNFYYDEEVRSKVVDISADNEFIDFGFEPLAAEYDAGEYGAKAEKLVMNLSECETLNGHKAQIHEFLNDNPRWTYYSYFDDEGNVKPAAETIYSTDLDCDGKKESFIIVYVPICTDYDVYMRSFIVFADSGGKMYLIDDTAYFSEDEVMLLDYGDFRQVSINCPGLSGAESHHTIWGLENGMPEMVYSIRGSFYKWGCFLGSIGHMATGGTMYFDTSAREYRYVITKQVTAKEIHDLDTSGSLDDFADEYRENFGEDFSAYTYDGTYYVLGHALDVGTPFRYENGKFTKLSDAQALRITHESEYNYINEVEDLGIDAALASMRKP